MNVSGKYLDLPLFHVVRQIWHIIWTQKNVNHAPKKPALTLCLAELSCMDRSDTKSIAVVEHIHALVHIDHPCVQSAGGTVMAFFWRTRWIERILAFRKARSVTCFQNFAQNLPLPHRCGPAASCLWFLVCKYEFVILAEHSWLNTIFSKIVFPPASTRWYVCFALQLCLLLGDGGQQKQWWLSVSTIEELWSPFGQDTKGICKQIWVLSLIHVATLTICIQILLTRVRYVSNNRIHQLNPMQISRLARMWCPRAWLTTMRSGEALSWGRDFLLYLSGNSCQQLAEENTTLVWLVEEVPNTDLCSLLSMPEISPFQTIDCWLHLMIWYWQTPVMFGRLHRRTVTHKKFRHEITKSSNAGSPICCSWFKNDFQACGKALT